MFNKIFNSLSDNFKMALAIVIQIPIVIAFVPLVFVIEGSVAVYNFVNDIFME